MSYYRVCEYCGSTLDPQEVCECWKKERDQNGDQDKEATYGGVQDVYAVSGVAREAEEKAMD